ncbi:MAG: hypothetical protein MMC23_008392 [Stictis urceolatum]|nr:hypothetical protein [Stictis urceolata]
MPGSSPHVSGPVKGAGHMPHSGHGQGITHHKPDQNGPGSSDDVRAGGEQPLAESKSFQQPSPYTKSSFSRPKKNWLSLTYSSGNSREAEIGQQATIPAVAQRLGDVAESQQTEDPAKSPPVGKLSNHNHAVESPNEVPGSTSDLLEEDDPQLTAQATRYLTDPNNKDHIPTGTQRGPNEVAGEHALSKTMLGSVPSQTALGRRLSVQTTSDSALSTFGQNSPTGKSAADIPPQIGVPGSGTEGTETPSGGILPTDSRVITVAIDDGQDSINTKASTTSEGQRMGNSAIATRMPGSSGSASGNVRGHLFSQSTETDDKQVTSREGHSVASHNIEIASDIAHKIDETSATANAGSRRTIGDSKAALFLMILVLIIV